MIYPIIKPSTIIAFGYFLSLFLRLLHEDNLDIPFFRKYLAMSTQELGPKDKITFALKSSFNFFNFFKQYIRRRFYNLQLHVGFRQIITDISFSRKIKETLLDLN